MLSVYQSITLAAHIHHASHMVIKKHYKVDKWEHEGSKSLSLSFSCSLSRAALVFWDWAISLVGVSLRYISPEHFLSLLTSSFTLKLRPQLPSNIQTHLYWYNTHNTDKPFLEDRCIWFVNRTRFIWKIVWVSRFTLFPLYIHHLHVYCILCFVSYIFNCILYCIEEVHLPPYINYLSL